MKFVVDTNILFSFFNKDSFSRSLILNPVFNLLSVDFASVELKKYSKLIMKKCKLSEEEFFLYLKELKKIVNFVSKKNYLKFISEAQAISPDKDDVDFFALSLKENVILWSNDKLLKFQEKVCVLNTQEIIDILIDE